MIDPKQELRINAGVYLPPIYNMDFKRLKDYDKWALDTIRNLNEAITVVNEYRKELYNQWQALEASPKHKLIELKRRKDYWNNKIYYDITISTVYEDLKQTNTDKVITYKGIERFKAFKEFKKLIKQYPNAEVKDFRENKNTAL